MTSTASFRNDLIIRGGAPNENRFFVDDIEVPVINHFFYPRIICVQQVSSMWTLTAGATDIGLTLDGPLSKKSTFLFSARRSYLQFLFKAIGLPFLPTYTDFNMKYKYKIDNKNEISFIGLGAIDDFSLN
ncbi:MAG: hypothetical protein IPN46_19610 [Saprospiraceae bacterium]|nr:hypothetical protein [Saprospiraceae bacterium]